MKRQILHSWLLLLYFDWIMHWRKFRELHRIVEEEPIRPTTSARILNGDKNIVDCGQG